MAEIFVVGRHGESTANTKRQISNRIGDNEPLTPVGINQAKQFLDQIQGGILNIQHIYSSPLLRAKQTAKIIGEGLGLEVVVADGLREPDCGIIEGRSDDEAWKMHSAQETAWKNGEHDYRISGGESYNEVTKRFVTTMQDIFEKHKDDPGNVLIISHGSVIQNVLPELVSNITKEFTHAHPIPNCSYVVVKATEYGLICEDWCGIPVP